LIFLLDAIALSLGDDGVNSVRIMERIFAVLGVTAIVAVVYRGFGKLWLGYVAGLLYLIHFYELFVFEHGNVTEEYGTVLVLLGIAAVVAAVKAPSRKGVVLAGLGGITFSAAILCKEPFLLLAPPWFLYVAWGHDGNWQLARRRTVVFLMGAVVPGLIFLSYLLWHGAWGEWVDVVAFNLSNNAGAIPRQSEPYLTQVFRMAYTKVFSTLLLTQVAAMLGLAHAVWWLIVKRTLGLPIIVAASALMGLLATSLGGGYSGHYYLFFVPSYILLGASGLAFVVSIKSAGLRWTAVAAVLALVIWNLVEVRVFARQLAEPSKRWQGHELSSVIRNNTSPRDEIWVPWAPLLYMESHRLSPTKWYFVFDHLFIDTPRSSAEEKYRTLKMELEQRPPRVIVLNAPVGRGRTRANADAFLRRSDLKDWIAENYWTVLGSSSDRYQMLVSREPLPDSSTEPDTYSLNAMQAGSRALYEERDPIKAIFQFYQVLALVPTHYGARFQLAKALDAAGQRVEARRAWQDVHSMATAIRDSTSIEVARGRLSRADAETPDAWMAAGLSCFYTLNDALCAIAMYRKVLGVNESHYGANHQLAKTLDHAGRFDEGTLQWRIVLGLAKAARDSDMALTAQSRLQQLQ
jgi:tetratricopeptide (TPR) repeat protein